MTISKLFGKKKNVLQLNFFFSLDNILHLRTIMSTPHTTKTNGSAYSSMKLPISFKIYSVYKKLHNLEFESQIWV